ncbi:MAG TPA: hypothetical protein VN597_02450, partial [Streptosporangiaceae bacterium]|nr:hypothetical protein [Streptosporangiaceae bacterium]
MTSTARPGQQLTGPALMSAACLLGAADVAGWSTAEQRLVQRGNPGWQPAGQDTGPAGDPGRNLDTELAREQIQAGQDPLGDAFCV